MDLDDNISVMAGHEGASFFTSAKFSEQIKDLTNSFDQVFICSSNINAQLELMALSEFSPSLVVIASLRKTKKLDIKNLTARKPIDLLLHD